MSKIYYINGWWFKTFVIFHNIWDNPSHLLIFFRGGLKPPTSNVFVQNPFFCLGLAENGSLAPQRLSSIFMKDMMIRREIWETLFSDTMTNPNNREVKSQKHQGQLTIKETRRAPEGCCQRVTTHVDYTIGTDPKQCCHLFLECGCGLNRAVYSHELNISRSSPVVQRLLSSRCCKESGRHIQGFSLTTSVQIIYYISCIIYYII